MPVRRLAATWLALSTLLACTLSACEPQPFGAVAGLRAARAARIGAYYFDGWSGALDSPHLRGLMQTAYRGREPLSGWRDATPAAVDAELRTAHQDGIDFFVFDWYRLHPGSAMPYLDNALAIYRRLPDHHGVGYALCFVNDHEWSVSAREWPQLVREWVADFRQPDYVRVGGKPLLVILDAGWMLRSFGGRSGAQAAVEALRTAARANGLPGVFVVAGAQISRADSDVRAAVAGVGYDALTAYNCLYVYAERAVPAPAGPVPYRELVEVSRSVWDQAAQTSPLPYVPSVTTGWDPRPWNERVGGRLFWFLRTPGEFAGNVHVALVWLQDHPERAGGGSAGEAPLLFLEAWNEIGEGAYLLPTRGDGNSYGLALSQVLRGMAASPGAGAS